MTQKIAQLRTQLMMLTDGRLLTRQQIDTIPTLVGEMEEEYQRIIQGKESDYDAQHKTLNEYRYLAAKQRQMIRRMNDNLVTLGNQIKIMESQLGLEL